MTRLTASIRVDRGFTLIEMAVVLAVLAILAGVLTPVITGYVDEARASAAQSDTRVIADAISRFEKDLGRYPMFSSGAGLLQNDSANQVRLAGPGTLPAETAATAWTQGSPTDTDCVGPCFAGLIADQLMTNGPVYPTAAAASKQFRWKGPYLSPQTDPWNRAYLVNIINAKSTSGDACFVLSAGPNGVVETAFNISRTAAVAAGGDDIISRIR